LGLFVDSLKSDGSADYRPTAVPKRVDVKSKVVDIASGCHHILLLTDEGQVLSFGEGSKGQLGRIESRDLQSVETNRKLFLEPQEVHFGADGVVIEKVWANHWSSYAKSIDGDVYVWGLNNYHQLGFKSDGCVEVMNADPNESQTSLKLIIELQPIKSPQMPANVQMIANGQHHVLALDSEGQVFACGSNTYCKLGFKSDSAGDQTVDTPRLIARSAFGDQKVSHVACGEFCSLAITASGHVFGWGQGSKHIGSQDFTDIEVPTRVRGVLADETRFASVSAGSQHTLLVGYGAAVNGK
jgi:regulator of chromosome condensation